MPRVDWLIEDLSKCCSPILQGFNEEFHFTSPPTQITLEGTGKGLNDRLFGPIRPPASNPLFWTSVKRTHSAFVKDPHSPVDAEEVQRHLQQLRRGKGGRFAGRHKKRAEGEQLDFSGYDATFDV